MQIEHKQQVFGRIRWFFVTCKKVTRSILHRWQSRLHNDSGTKLHIPAAVRFTVRSIVLFHGGMPVLREAQLQLCQIQVLR